MLVSTDKCCVTLFLSQNLSLSSVTITVSSQSVFLPLKRLSFLFNHTDHQRAAGILDQNHWATSCCQLYLNQKAYLLLMELWTGRWTPNPLATSPQIWLVNSHEISNGSRIHPPSHTANTLSPYQGISSVTCLVCTACTSISQRKKLTLAGMRLSHIICLERPDLCQTSAAAGCVSSEL